MAEDGEVDGLLGVGYAENREHIVYYTPEQRSVWETVVNGGEPRLCIP